MILRNVLLSDILDLVEHTSMTTFVPTIETRGTEPNKQINLVGWRRRNMGFGTRCGRVSLFITPYLSSWPYQLASQWMGAVELWNELAIAILCLSARFIWSKISYCDIQNRVPRDVWLSSLPVGYHLMRGFTKLIARQPVSIPYDKMETINSSVVGSALGEQTW